MHEWVSVLLASMSSSLVVDQKRTLLVCLFTLPMHNLHRKLMVLSCLQYLLPVYSEIGQSRNKKVYLLSHRFCRALGIPWNISRRRRYLLEHSAESRVLCRSPQEKRNEMNGSSIQNNKQEREYKLAWHHMVKSIIPSATQKSSVQREKK